MEQQHKRIFIPGKNICCYKTPLFMVMSHCIIRQQIQFLCSEAQSANTEEGATCCKKSSWLSGWARNITISDSVINFKKGKHSRSIMMKQSDFVAWWTCYLMAIIKYHSKGHCGVCLDLLYAITLMQLIHFSNMRIAKNILHLLGADASALL